MIKTLEERFNDLSNNRMMKLERARDCAALTLPSLLPPEGFAQNNELIQPFSSVPGRGVTAMAARMLSAMLPLSDEPFFKFGSKDGTSLTLEENEFLERLAQQANRALISENLRDTLFLALQHLIVAGDVMIWMEDDFKFSLYRMDQYVVRRDVNGQLIELLYVEYEPVDPEGDSVEYTVTSTSMGMQRPEYMPVFCRVVFDHDTENYSFEKEIDGKIVDTGEYAVAPFAVLRWSALVGEDYGRSHCEEIIGDLNSLEAYTQSLIEGMAASSRFYMAVSGSGTTDIDDLTATANGDWIQARAEDVFVLSPANTMKPATSAAMEAVNTMRAEVSKAFLMQAGQVRNAERVTATEVRIQAQELEQVLGGAFSAISRDLMTPIIERVMYILIAGGDVDPRLAEAFSEGGRLSVRVVTGLQALSRDKDLERLMQMGSTIQQLPPEAQANFKFDEYARALVTALGFDSRNWVISEEEKQAKAQAEQAQQAMMQAGQAGMTAAATSAGAAAGPDLAEAMGTTPPPMM